MIKTLRKIFASFLAICCACLPVDAATLRSSLPSVSAVPSAVSVFSWLVVPASALALEVHARPLPVVSPAAGSLLQDELSATVEKIVHSEKASGAVLDKLYSGSTAKTETERLPNTDLPKSLGGRGAAALSAKEAPAQGPLTRIEANPRWADVRGRFLVKDLSRRSSDLTIPQATRLAAFVARSLLPSQLDDASMTNIFVVTDFRQAALIAESRSGEVRRIQRGSIMVDTDVDGKYRSIFILRAALDYQLAPPPGFIPPSLTSQTAPIPVRRTRPRRLGNLVPHDATIFVGGITSVSAEPAEGFFAAATQSELQSLGRKLLPAAQAKIWIYRTPDARSQSYFKFGYLSEDRPTATAYEDKFKIATGIGTSHSPDSDGGAEASLLWLGDEMQGMLASYLSDVSKPDLTLEDLERHQGFIQRLNRREVYVGRIDQTHALTQEGFDGLTTDPAIYRRVYSPTMDNILLEHLNPSNTPRKTRGQYSFVFASSRGCGQGCSICPTGGLSPFQAFSAQRIMRELAKIAEHIRVRPGEVIELFFLDSNFNHDPRRIIELADLLDHSPLKSLFHFYCRHNSVSGFLKPDASGALVANLELIDAYVRLGISPVFLGIDAYDDAGIKTLKTNTRRLARFGAQTRPTYTFAELRGLIRAFEARKLPVRGFALVGNPWVSDLNRLDSYYNLFELWLENPHFTIDSGMETYLRLKPMAGAPITEVSEAMQRPPLAGYDKDLYTAGRFSARGPLGEMDELPEMQRFFQSLLFPRRGFNIENVISRFREGIAQVRRKAAMVYDDPKAADNDRQRAGHILRKLAARDAQLGDYLREHEHVGPRINAWYGLLPGWLRSLGPRKLRPNALPSLIKDMSVFAGIYRNLSPLERNFQDHEAENQASSLILGLRRLLGEKPDSSIVMGSLSFQTGYAPEIADLRPGAPHTIKDLDRYIKENLGEAVLEAKDRPDVRFVIVEGDGQEARKKLEIAGWQLGQALPKVVGFHRFYKAVTPEGLSALVALHINGRDRLIHIQSFFKLLGVSPERILTMEGFRSWKENIWRRSVVWDIFPTPWSTA